MNARPQRGDGPLVARRGSEGLTLVEVIVAVLLIATAALIAFPTLLSFFDLSQTARDQNIAHHDLQAAAEEILATPFSLVTKTYQDGQAIPKYTDRHLAAQRIVVNYPDPSRDPLEVQLTVAWNDAKGRAMQDSLRLLRTQ